MSTNKTEHFGLHSWVPEDELHLSEINENFEKLDLGAVRILTGSYSYNFSERIELGVKPLAVIVHCTGGNSNNTSLMYHGLASQDMPYGTALVLDESGFTPGRDDSYSARLVSNVYGYHYIVFY